MSVEVCFYAVYGVQLSYSDCEEFNEEYGDDEKGIDAVIDYMCGDYAVIGKILAKLSEYEDSGEELLEVDVSGLKNIEKSYRKGFAEAFPEHVNLIEGKPFKLIFMKHYT